MASPDVRVTRTGSPRQHTGVEKISLEEAYEKWADELVRFATVLVGPDAAPDVVAEAFVPLLDHDDTWARVERPRAYLFGAVANRARMHHRTTWRRRQRDRAALRPAPTTAIPTDDSLGELDATTALRGLSSQQRTFVYLAYWEDWTAADIADRLGVSEGTVRRQLARGRHKLREALA